MNRKRLVTARAALVLLLTAAAGCDRNPVSALADEVQGTWVRSLDTTAQAGTSPLPVLMHEFWIFDSGIYRHQIEFYAPSTGQHIAHMAEEGTFTAGRGKLNLTRLKLFQRAPDTSPVPGSPEAEPQPVTPLSWETLAAVTGDELALGGCSEGAICVVGPTFFQRMRFDPF